MDPNSRILMMGAGGPVAPTLTQHFALVDATYNGGSGTGTYQGNTGTTSQGAARWGGFTGSRYFEWTVNTSWSDSGGMVGILDSAHWNSGPSYTSSTGERAMMYLGNSFSYGDNTGTVQSGAGITFSNGDTCGCVWNETTGKLAFYKNGTLGPVFTNTGFIGVTKFPCIAYWTSVMIGTMRTTPSTYASSYALPT